MKKIEQNSFEHLIKDLPRDLSVLDVGAAGLGGENTTDYLVDWFSDYEGICTDEESVAAYLLNRSQLRMREPKITVGEFDIDRVSKKKYDLLVMDGTIEKNIALWSSIGLKKLSGLVKKGGYLITYIMLTDDYGDEGSKKLLKKHRKSFWKNDELKTLESIPYWNVSAVMQELRRPEILWVLLKKK